MMRMNSLAYIKDALDDTTITHINRLNAQLHSTPTSPKMAPCENAAAADFMGTKISPTLVWMCLHSVDAMMRMNSLAYIKDALDDTTITHINRLNAQLHSKAGCLSNLVHWPKHLIVHPTIFGFK